MFYVNISADYMSTIFLVEPVDLTDFIHLLTQVKLLSAIFLAEPVNLIDFIRLPADFNVRFRHGTERRVGAPDDRC